MLSFFLIGACVALKSGLLQPVPSAGTANFLQTAKTNPRALIQMLQGADPTVINTIIQLLTQLRDDSVTEENRLTTVLNSANDTLTQTKALLAAAESTLVRAEIDQENKNLEYNTKLGTYNQVLQEHDEEVPTLENEISIFEQVIEVLIQLRDGASQEESLLQLEQISGAEHYQKLLEDAKADPTKIDQIIALIESLSSQSSSALNATKARLETATNELNTAKSDKDDADAALTTAQGFVSTQQTAVGEAQGKMDEAQSEYDARYTTVVGETATLNEVIGILTQMLAEQ